MLWVDMDDLDNNTQSKPKLTYTFASSIPFARTPSKSNNPF